MKNSCFVPNEECIFFYVFFILHLITFFKIWYFAQLALTLQGFWCIPTEKCHERILLSVQKTDNKE